MMQVPTTDQDRFPRPCRLVERRFSDLAGEFGIGEALAHDVGDGQMEAVTVGHVRAVTRVQISRSSTFRALRTLRIAHS
jgi:hypothetical protein